MLIMVCVGEGEAPMLRLARNDDKRQRNLRRTGDLAEKSRRYDRYECSRSQSGQFE